MNVDMKQFPRCELVKISGRVDSSNAHEMEDAISNIMGRGQFRIVLDLSELAFLSSSGIRALLSLSKAARRWNRGDVRIACMPRPIYDTFDLAGLTKVFRFFPSTVEAVGSF
jgi:anti-anti-sigma factor